MPSNSPASRWAETPILIAALSARALAASARRGGFIPWVLDVFNDADTLACAAHSRCVAWGAEGLRAQDVLDAAAGLASSTEGLVYGSGFERQPELLGQLEQRVRVFGNTAATVAAAKAPADFFALLDNFDIPHPETSLQPPTDARGWLLKHGGGAGGVHIRCADPAHTVQPGCYFQRLWAGCPMSVLFLADGKQAHVIGYNAQWITPGLDQPFRYGGAINHAALGERLAGQISAVVSRLVTALGLKGLNGIDFMVEGDSYAVLEVNPRPTATCDLYDADYHTGLFAAHIAACCGELGDLQPSERTVRAHAIVYTPCAGVVPAALRWPDWVSDRPHAQTHCPADFPLCTVYAHGAEHGAVRNLLAQRLKTVTQWFEGAQRDTTLLCVTN
ncbi:MAG: ATP-grasp domain-containing protein [Burkholderiales bacterium]